MVGYWDSTQLSFFVQQALHNFFQIVGSLHAGKFHSLENLQVCCCIPANHGPTVAVLDNLKMLHNFVALLREIAVPMLCICTFQTHNFANVDIHGSAETDLFSEEQLKRLDTVK